MSVDAPIGVPIDDAKQLALLGRWIDDDGDVVEIRRTKDGQLTSGWLRWDEDSQQFAAETIPLEVRRVRDTVFLYIKGENGYLFTRISKITDSEILLHDPDPDRFRNAVENGLLLGDVRITGDNKDRFDVRLYSEKEQTISALAEAEVGDLFLEDEPRRYSLLKSLQD